MPAKARAHVRQQGVAAVELALLMPVLLLIFLGIAGMSRLYYLQMALVSAARAGVQFAQAGQTQDTARIAAAARRDALHDAPGMAMPDVAIRQRCADGSPYAGNGKCPGYASAPWTYVEVRTSYVLADAGYPLLPGFAAPLRLQHSATARLR
ncbi:MAG: TadE/TadG family type IV pilus assembly protein [Janthinobacterium sp.]|uniref:TadE/TadG family type IV pilus assembly protein n=1 Tax=Janthinobacterium sp. TND4EL3 TaxID=1907311 RepID=UPI000957453E|nr:TadE/TadG family type IV pilus assembly protein [Janthinobacterium sp. TND4EL3]SIR34104.1 TadE-like protein [Janthinobacterium sp. TND4EL3]